MRRKHRQGFTLVELVVAAALLSVLSAIAVPSYLSYVRTSRIESAKAGCEVIGAAIAQAHVRGTDIRSSENGGWEDIGMIDPSNGGWRYAFPRLRSGEDEDGSFYVGAQGRKGSLKGRQGRMYPWLPHPHRFQGLFKEE